MNSPVCLVYEFDIGRPHESDESVARGELAVHDIRRHPPPRKTAAALSTSASGTRPGA